VSRLHPRPSCLLRIAVVVAALVCPTIDAHAQDLKPALVNFLNPLGGGTAGSAMATIAALEVSTAPLGTSTGGFTFVFNPTLRAWTRSAPSFGPAFAERSLTTGQLKVSAGFNWLHAKYNSFGGQDLSNADFKPSKNIKGFTNLPAANFTAVQMQLSSDTFVAFGHAGITDTLDVGLAVPFIQVHAKATGAIFSASGTNLFSSSMNETTESGVGDIAVFGKYRLWRQDDGGAAAAVEIRLPTGDSASLRGLGVTRTLVSGIWSRGGMISPHVNVGYEFWSKGVPLRADGTVSAKNQVKYAAGVEVTPMPRMTVVVDLVGRNLLNGGQVGYQTFAGSVPNSSIDALLALPKGVHVISLVPSVKWNVYRSVLLTGNVLISLSNNGLRADSIPVVGLDWAF